MRRQGMRTGSERRVQIFRVFGGLPSSDFFKLLAFGFTLRVLLLWLFPVPYGEDGFGRLYFQDRIFLAHWLPLTQLVVYLTAPLSEGILLTRLAFALLGSLAAYGFYIFLRRVVSRPAALMGGLLFSVNALYLQLSLMPYQDVLFLGLFYGALGIMPERGVGHRESGVRATENESEIRLPTPDSRFPTPGSRLPSLLFGLACLTRYESWFLIPVLVYWQGWRLAAGTSWTVRLQSLLRAGLSFGWGPLLWLALSQFYWGGWERFLFQTAQGEFYAWNPHLDLGWMGAYAMRMLYWVGRFGSPLLLLALPAIASLLRRERALSPPLALLLIFGGLVTVFFFTIIGKQQDTVFRFCMIPLSIALTLSVLGLEESCRWQPLWNKARTGGALLMGLLVLYAAIPLYRLNQDPAFRDPYLIAGFLESRLREGEAALVVSSRSRSLDDAAPLAYQRIVAQIRVPRRQVLSAGLLQLNEDGELRRFAQRQGVRFLVLFEDFQPWLDADRFFAGLVREEPGRFEVVLEVERARVYEARGWGGGEGWGKGGG